MEKTDKELMAEIVCAHIHAWGTQDNCTPLKGDNLPGLIKSVYDAIHALGDSGDDAID